MRLFHQFVVLLRPVAGRNRPCCLEPNRFIPGRRWRRWQQQWRLTRQRSKELNSSRWWRAFSRRRGSPGGSPSRLSCFPGLQALIKGPPRPWKEHVEGGGPGGGTGEKDQDAGEGAPGNEEGDAGPPREDQPGPGLRQPSHHRAGTQ